VLRFIFADICFMVFIANQTTLWHYKIRLGQTANGKLLLVFNN